MSGSSFNQRAVILRYALKTKDIKNVIYSLDDMFEQGSPTNTFDFLYDNNQFNDIRIYSNAHFITCAIRWSLDSKCVGDRIDIYADSIWFWIFPYWIAYFGGIDNYLSLPKNKESIENYLKTKDSKQDSKSYKINTQYLKENIFDIVATHPQTQFYFIIPTYSRLYYKLKGESNFNRWKENIIYFITQSENLTNIRIYGFDDLDYADNIANYKDDAHYNMDMNLMQLHAIKSKTHILDSNNIHNYLKTMQEKINKYNIDDIIKHIN